MEGTEGRIDVEEDNCREKEDGKEEEKERTRERRRKGRGVGGCSMRRMVRLGGGRVGSKANGCVVSR